MSRRPEDPRIAIRRPLSPSRSNEAPAQNAGTMTPTAATNWNGPDPKRPALDHNRPPYHQPHQSAQRPPPPHQNYGQPQQFGAAPLQRQAGQRPPPPQQNYGQAQQFGVAPQQRQAAQQQRTQWDAAPWTNGQGGQQLRQGGQQLPQGQQSPSVQRPPQQQGQRWPQGQQPPSAQCQPPSAQRQPPSAQRQPPQQQSTFGQPQRVAHAAPQPNFAYRSPLDPPRRHQSPATSRPNVQQNQGLPRPSGMTPRAPSASRVPLAQPAQQPVNNVVPTATRAPRPTGAAGPSTAAAPGPSTVQKSRQSPARAPPARSAGNEQDAQRPSTTRDSETQPRRRAVAPNAVLNVRFPSAQAFMEQNEFRRGLLQRNSTRLKAVLNKIDATTE